MAERNTAVPSKEAPPALQVAVTEMMSAMAARDELTEKLRQATAPMDTEIGALTTRIAEIETKISDDNEDAISRLALAEVTVQTSEGAVKTEAIAVRSRTGEAVFEFAGWTIATRNPTAGLVVTPEDDLGPLVNELKLRFPGELDSVLPRGVSISQLKALVNYAAAAKRPLMYAQVTTEGKPMVVAIKAPAPKPEATGEHEATAEAVAAAAGTSWEDLAPDGE